MQKYSQGRKNSFMHALGGLKTLLSTQPNARLEFIFTILVIAAGFFFNISTTEWITVILFITLVLVSEIFNTMLEMILDKIEPQYDEHIKKIKDIAAAGVLISVTAAAIGGLIIFLPKLSGLLARLLENL